MPDDMNIDAYITSPYSSDLKKQRDAAFDSARNIRKVTETPESAWPSKKWLTKNN